MILSQNSIFRSILLIFLSFPFSLFSNAQTKRVKRIPATIIYAGEYSYGKNPEKEDIGTAYVYSENDSAILFYLDLITAAPKYRSGSIWGEVVIKKGQGLFIASLKGFKKSCELSFQFKNQKLIIKTIGGNDDCGFGYGVFADGVFNKISDKNPEYFFTREGTKVYFKKIKLKY
jgi:hypothetical protein